MRALRICLSVIAGWLLLLLVVGLIWAFSLRLSDPLDALRRDRGPIRVLADSAYPARTAAGEARLYRDVTIDTESAGTIRVTISRPVEPPPGPLPLVMILAGLRTGRESLGVVTAHGPNVLVGYQYPYDRETWFQNPGLSQVPAIRTSVLNVPWQVVRVTEMLRDEPDIDPARTALLGYSFGAMFLPAALRLAADEGRGFGAAILAFGGVDIEALLDANLRVRPGALRRALAWIIATLIHPMEPEHHLPHLRGRFLLIRGAADEQIPQRLSARLAELVPEPREVVTLEAGHMNPRDPVLTQRVVRLSQEWLARQGVIEPVHGD